VVLFLFVSLFSNDDRTKVDRTGAAVKAIVRGGTAG